VQSCGWLSCRLRILLSVSLSFCFSGLLIRLGFVSAWKELYRIQISLQALFCRCFP
jgi:hypothetical protein